MVKLRVFYRPPIHPEGIRFSDHSVQDVMIQISRAYRKKYVCFIKPIDTAAVDELGGGCMGTDESLDNMLAFLSSENGYCLSCIGNTILIRKKAPINDRAITRFEQPDWKKGNWNRIVM